MVVDDVHLMNILKGKRIKLTLKTSSFFGDVQRINPNRTLVLKDVVNASNGCKIPGSKLFFGNEIIDVEFTSETNNDKGVPDTGPEVKGLGNYKKMITIDDDDKEEEERINLVVIDEFHENFAPAVMHIKKQQVIGVGANGFEVFRHGRLCWLQIATKNKVYLFDILLLGARAFKNGLSAILECKDILKVIHDCRAIAGCLSLQFGVKVNNVFDTQVADVMCFHSETGGFLPDRVSTLQEVISLHLKAPSSQLRTLQRLSQSGEDKEMWFIRPCPSTLMKAMALAVVHLQPLRLVLMDTLMTDYMTLVDSYLNSSQYEPDELQHVGKDLLAIPRELMQLQQMYRERNQWATKHYPVTESGLLVRFEPRTTSPSKTASELQVENPTPDECFRPPSVLQEDTPAKSTSESCKLQTHLQISTKENPSVPFLEGMGCTEALMNTIGRGKPVGKKQSSTYNLTPMGRGFFFQEPPEENTGTINSPGRMELTSLCPGLTVPHEATP